MVINGIVGTSKPIDFALVMLIAQQITLMSTELRQSSSKTALDFGAIERFLPI